MKSTRSEAPYLPSNIQYIANNNALDSKEDVSGAVPATPSVHSLLCTQRHTNPCSTSVRDTVALSHSATLQQNLWLPSWLASLTKSLTHPAVCVAADTQCVGVCLC